MLVLPCGYHERECCCVIRCLKILPLEMKLLVLLSAVPVVAMASVKGGAATWGFLKAHEGTCCTCELLLQEITKVQTAQMDTIGERWSNPAKSCAEIAKGKPGSVPGTFWIENPLGSPVLVECASADNTSDLVSVRVANIDMKKPSHKCPGEFTEFTYGQSKRLCARRQSSGGCVSAIFSTHGLPYSTVYGRIIGYQFGSPSGFYTPYTPNDIDSAYMEGVSVTHGQSPRKHIWSFANALYENTGFDRNRHICPCTNPASTMQQYIPAFVGDDYFCDSGAQDTWRSGILYPNDPLWDSSGCGLASTCCTFNNPPYFKKVLPQTTTDDIEVRLCADQDGNNDEDSPLEIIELYIY